MTTTTLPHSLIDRLREFDQRPNVLYLQDLAHSDASKRGREAVVRDLLAHSADHPEHEFVISTLLKHLFHLIEGTRDSYEREQLVAQLTGPLFGNASVHVKALLLDVLCDCNVPPNANVLVAFVLDRNNPTSFRKEALRCLEKARPTSADLRILIEELPDLPPDLVAWSLDVLESHGDIAPRERMRMVLYRLIESESTPRTLRVRGLESLGVFGEINDVERMAMLFAGRSEYARGLALMVERIVSRPINVRYVKPENLEVLVLALLDKLGYHSIVITQASHDDGIDLLATEIGSGLESGSEHLVGVQCKRWRRGNVRADAVDEFSLALKRQDARKGIFVTTTGFADDVAERKGDFPHILLIDGEELVRLLNLHLGEGRYTLGV